MLLKIIIGILVIIFVFCVIALIFSLYISSLPYNKQDEALDNILGNIQNKFIDFWK